MACLPPERHPTHLENVNAALRLVDQNARDACIARAGSASFWLGRCGLRRLQLACRNAFEDSEAEFAFCVVVVGVAG